MSAVIYAKQIRCDWPDCKSVADVAAPPGYLDETVPEGWACFRYGLRIVTTLGAGQICDFCSIHAMATVASLSEAFGTQVAH